MWICVFALFGVFLVQHCAAYQSSTNCAVYCQELRSTKLQLDTHHFLMCRCGLRYPALPRVTYGVVHQYSKDYDLSDNRKTNGAFLNSFNGKYMPGEYHQMWEDNFQPLPENSEFGSLDGPIAYKKPMTVTSQLHRDAIQSKLSTLKKTLLDITTQQVKPLNRENYVTNGHLDAKHILVHNSNKYDVSQPTSIYPKYVEIKKRHLNNLDSSRIVENVNRSIRTYNQQKTKATSRFDEPHSLLKINTFTDGQINDEVFDHKKSSSKQSESLDHTDPIKQLQLLKRSSPLYWSQKKYNVDNTIPEGSPLIMDVGLKNKVEYRMGAENADSTRIIDSLDDYNTKENYRNCLNLLELHNYQSSDNRNKTMTTSIKNLLKGKFANYTAEEISSKIKVTCNDTYTLFQTGFDEIIHKDKIMHNKMKTLRSAGHTKMIQENSPEVLSEAPAVVAPSEIYWTDATTQPLKSSLKDNQVLPEPLSVTKKISTTYPKHYLPKGISHPLVQSRKNIVRDQISAKHYPQTVSRQLEVTTEDRPVVMEKERKVPKLVISENKAGLKSKFGELEKIDDNDFVRKNNGDGDNLSLVEAVNSLDTGKSGNDPSIEPINMIPKHHSNPVTSTKQYEFVQWPLSLDNLYITHQDLKLPINFVPNAYGKVDILIDGQYICNQLLQKPDRSLLLLQILCNANNKEKIQNLEENMKACSHDKGQNTVG